MSGHGVQVLERVKKEALVDATIYATTTPLLAANWPPLILRQNRFEVCIASHHQLAEP